MTSVGSLLDSIRTKLMKVLVPGGGHESDGTSLLSEYKSRSHFFIGGYSTVKMILYYYTLPLYSLSVPCLA